MGIIASSTHRPTKPWETLGQPDTSHSRCLIPMQCLLISQRTLSTFPFKSVAQLHDASSAPCCQALFDCCDFTTRPPCQPSASPEPHRRTRTAVRVRYKLNGVNMANLLGDVWQPRRHRMDLWQTPVWGAAELFYYLGRGRERLGDDGSGLPSGRWFILASWDLRQGQREMDFDSHGSKWLTLEVQLSGLSWATCLYKT